MPSTNEDAARRTEAMSSPQPLPLWRNRDYLLLWGGQTVSVLGTGISQLAYPLLILALTHSPAQAGFAAALRALPYFLLSLPAGALIDRWNRKQVMIICDSGRALCLASIPFALAIGHLTILQLYLTSLVEGIFYVFFNLAEVACLPRVVPKEQLSAATGQNEAASSVTSLLSPSLGGVLYSVSRVFPFLSDAISYTVSLISLFFIRATFQEERDSAPRKLGVEIMEGLSWLWHQPLIRTLAVLTGVSNLVFAGSPLIVIVLAQHLHAPPATIGIIFAIEGIGGIIGSLVASPLQKRLSFGAVVIGVYWIQVVLWPLYALAPNPFMLGAIAAGLFFIGPIYNVVQFSYRIALIPDVLQGRVNSVFRLFAFGFNPLGFALTGILLQRVGTTPTLLIYELCLILLALLTLNTSIRKAREVATAEAA